MNFIIFVGLSSTRTSKRLGKHDFISFRNEYFDNIISGASGPALRPDTRSRASPGTSGLEPRRCSGRKSATSMPAIIRRTVLMLPADLGLRPPEKVLICAGASWLTDLAAGVEPDAADFLSRLSVDGKFHGLRASLGHRSPRLVTWGPV